MAFVPPLLPHVIYRGQNAAALDLQDYVTAASCRGEGVLKHVWRYAFALVSLHV